MSYKTQKIPFFRVLRIFLSYDFLSAVPQGTNVRYHKITKSGNEMPQKVEMKCHKKWNLVGCFYGILNINTPLPHYTVSISCTSSISEICGHLHKNFLFRYSLKVSLYKSPMGM